MIFYHTCSYIHYIWWACLLKSRGEITRATNFYPKNIKNTDQIYEKQWKSDIIQTENSIFIYTNCIFTFTCISFLVTHHVTSTSILLCVAFSFFPHGEPLILDSQPILIFKFNLEKLETLSKNPQWPHQAGSQ